jgi:hypothetical protein
MAIEATAKKLRVIPLFPLLLVILVVVVYAVLILLPAMIDGIPSNFLALIWPPGLIIVGFAAMIWGRSMVGKGCREEIILTLCHR